MRVVEVLTVVALLVVLAVLITPNFIRCHCGSQFTACKNNLKNIATAVEMYSTDNDGRFPSAMPLIPNYLRCLPTCPTAATITYADGYLVTVEPDSYFIACFGVNHRGVGIVAPHYPRHDVSAGVLERP